MTKIIDQPPKLTPKLRLKIAKRGLEMRRQRYALAAKHAPAKPVG